MYLGRDRNVTIALRIPVSDPVLLGNGARLLLAEKLALLVRNLDCVILRHLVFMVAGTFEEAKLGKKKPQYSIYESNEQIPQWNCWKAGQDARCFATDPWAASSSCNQRR